MGAQLRGFLTRDREWSPDQQRSMEDSRGRHGRAGSAGTSYFSPTDISGLADWHRSDLGITLVGSKVSDWADQSGRVHHLTQGTDANRPSYELNVLAGKPSVRLTAASSHFMSWTPWAKTSTTTVFAVVKMQSAPSAYQLLAGDSSAGWRFYASMAAPSAGSPGIFCDAAQRTPSAGALDTSAHLIWWDVNSGGANGLHCQIDNNAVAVSAHTAGVTHGNFADFGALSGLSEFLNADVFELAIYSRVLSEGEIQKFKDYTRSRYGVPA